MGFVADRPLDRFRSSCWDRFPPPFSRVSTSRRDASRVGKWDMRVAVDSAARFEPPGTEQSIGSFRIGTGAKADVACPLLPPYGCGQATLSDPGRRARTALRVGYPQPFMGKTGRDTSAFARVQRTVLSLRSVVCPSSYITPATRRSSLIHASNGTLRVLCVSAGSTGKTPRTGKRPLSPFHNYD